MAETITINADSYWQLVQDQKLLDALIKRGVDNWDGYEEALDEALND